MMAKEKTKKSEESDEEATKCEVCGDEIENEEYEFCINDHIVCESCGTFEGQYSSLIIIDPNNPDRDHEENDEFTIRYYTDEIYDGDIDGFGKDVEKAAKAIMKGTYYHHYDAWRGTYAVKLENEKDAAHLDDLQLLWGHHSEELEKRRMELLKRVIKKLHITLIVTILPSSNVFCINGDYFCCAKDAEIMKLVMAKLNELTKKDDPRWSIGILFSDLQQSAPTKDVVRDLEKVMASLKQKPRK